MKKQKIQKFNPFEVTTSIILEKNKEKHLPLFATSVAVMITTVICAGFDGSNIYLTLASASRDNVLLMVILACGTTLMLNFGGTVLGHIIKCYYQEYGGFKKWMIYAFSISLGLLFLGVFVFRYANADGPFVDSTPNVSLGGNTALVNNSGTVDPVIKYSLATIVNISSVVSTALCFVIGYINSDPQAQAFRANITILDEFIERKLLLIGAKSEMNSITKENLDKFEKERFQAQQAIAEAESLIRKTRFAEQLMKKGENSDEIDDITKASQAKLNAFENVEKTDIAGNADESIQVA